MESRMIGGIIKRGQLEEDTPRKLWMKDGSQSSFWQILRCAMRVQPLIAKKPCPHCHGIIFYKIKNLLISRCFLFLQVLIETGNCRECTQSTSLKLTQESIHCKSTPVNKESWRTHNTNPLLDIRSSLIWKFPAQQENDLRSSFNLSQLNFTSNLSYFKISFEFHLISALVQFP